MGWVHEQLPSAAHTKVWQRKVLVLRKLQLQIFSSALVGQTIPSFPGLYISLVSCCTEVAGLGNVHEVPMQLSLLYK